MADGSIKVYVYDNIERKVVKGNTVHGVLDAWQGSLEFDTLRDRSKKIYVGAATHLYDAFKGVDIKDVDRGHLLEMRDTIAKKIGHGSAITFCKVASVFFKWAVEHKKIKLSPATNMLKPLKHKNLPTWTLQQALEAEEKFIEPYNRFVYLARHTAQRRGDLCKMGWSDYNGTQLRVIQEKTGVELTIPVTGEFKLTLDQWKREANGLTILTTREGQKLRAKTVTDYFGRACKKLGFPQLNVHGLRKLAAVTAAEAGCTVHEIASLTGHKTLSMVELYTKEASQQKLSEAAISKIEDFADAQKRKKTQSLQ
jgi:integrase